jgi:serine/threonine protein kinase
MIHGDLKGVRGYPRLFFFILTSNQSNVLVDTAGQARITDFGLSEVVQDLYSLRSALAERDSSPRWIAPEVVDGNGSCSREGDVFSFAGVAIEVCCNQGTSDR